MATPQLRMAWPPATTTFKVMAAVLVGAWLLGLVPAVAEVRDSYLLLSPSVLREHYGAWTLLSYALWHTTLFHLVLNVVMLYLFGAEVESRLPGRHYIGLLLTATVVGGALAAAAALGLEKGPGAGIDAAVMALIAVFCVLNWEVELNLILIRIKGKIALLGLVVLQLTFGAIAGNVVKLGLDIGGLLAGVGYGMFITGSGGEWLKRRRYNKLKKNLTLVTRSPDEQDGKRKRNGEWIN